MNGGVLNNYYSLKDLLKTFSNDKHKILLLSEECLFLQDEHNSFFHEKNVLALLSNYNIKIIVYFRKSVDYLCGLWQGQESLKYNSQTDLLSFLDNKDYLKHLNNFHHLSETVGKENIIVRTFEPETWKNSCLIEDFLSIFKIKKSNKFKNLQSFENIGYTRQQCDKLLSISKDLDIKDYFQDDNEQRIIIPKGQNNQKVVDSLPDDVIAKFTDKYYPEECNIAKTFLRKKELFQTKYPKIYGTNRAEYKEKFSIKDKEELKELICKKNQLTELQKKSLKKTFPLLLRSFGMYF